MVRSATKFITRSDLLKAPERSRDVSSKKGADVLAELSCLKVGPLVLSCQSLGHHSPFMREY